MNINISAKTKESYLEHMANNLPSLRAQLGVTQEQLAQRLGVTRQTLTLIESKSRLLTWTNYLALCYIFENSEKTKALMEIYDICPDMVKNYLAFE